MHDIDRVLEGREFANIDEANAFLATLTGTGLQDALRNAAPPSAKEQAQELAFSAMDAQSEQEARELVQRALALDADCVDALVLKGDLEATTAREAIAALKKAVAAGERSLGAEFFRENKGDFWGILETRSYMRARAELAELLRSAGSTVQATQHYAGLLELNPNDNQGVRYPLLGCYLAQGRLRDAAKLLSDYRGDSMATFAWGEVLLRLLADDRRGAKKALNQARAENLYVELYFSGQAPVPNDLPDSYTLGSREEAAICFDHLGAAWAKHYDALFWLMDQFYGATGPSRRKHPPR